MSRKRLKPSDQLQLPIPLEKDEQIRLCVWLRKKNVLFYAIPNGGSRNYLEAVSLKKAGLLKGVPDLCIPMASAGKHSLYIELKRATKTSRVSPEQKEVIESLNQHGNLAVVCYGFDQAKKVIEDYLLGCSTWNMEIDHKRSINEQIYLPDVMQEL